MKINPQSFFNFCANHAPLLRALAERGGELSETEVMRLIRLNPGAAEEQPETAWRRLLEEVIFGSNFLVTALPHFTLDRYTALLRQVDVHDQDDLRRVLNRMEQIGWVKMKGMDQDEFRFLRPFHRVFSKCLELSAAKNQEANAPARGAEPQQG